MFTFFSPLCFYWSRVDLDVVGGTKVRQVLLQVISGPYKYSFPGISKKIPNNPLRLLPATKYNSKSPRSLSKGIKMTSPSGRKAFPGPGPYYFDYLLGEDNFFKTKADVVFIDYDLDATVITKWKSAGKVVICYVNVVRELSENLHNLICLVVGYEYVAVF